MEDEKSRDDTQDDESSGSNSSPRISSLIQLARAVSRDFTSYFYEVFAKQPEVERFFSHLSEREMKHQQIQFGSLIYDLLKSNPDQENLNRRLEMLHHMHRMVGLDSAWMVRAISPLLSMIKKTCDEDQALAEDATALESIARERVLQLIEGALTAEAKEAEHLASITTRITNICNSVTYASDLFLKSFEVLDSISGIDGIYLSRPDANGWLEPEHIVGFAFANFKSLSKAGLIAKESIRVDLPEGLGVDGRSWRSGEIETSGNIAIDPTMQPWAGVYGAMGIRSMAAVPITDSAGRPIALLSCHSRWPGYFDVSTRRFFLDTIRQKLGAALSELDQSKVLSHITRMEYRNFLYKDQVRMLYQPIVSLRNGKVVKVEALARLVDDSGKIVSPAAFLPAFGADELFHLFGLGLKAIGEARSIWSAQGFDPRVSINLPPQGLIDSRYLEEVKLAIQEMYVRQEKLTLEVTEDEELNELEDIGSIIAELKALGITLSQDDLGAGYSSLTRLERIGFDEVKIDQGLVRKTSDPTNAISLIEHLVDLAHDLGIRVVVEGLESVGLIEVASVLGADLGQGYSIAAPMEAKALLDWIATMEWEVDPSYPKTQFGMLAALGRLITTMRRSGPMMAQPMANAALKELRLLFGDFKTTKFNQLLVRIEHAVETYIPDEIEAGLEELRGLVRYEAVDWGNRPYVPPRNWHGFAATGDEDEISQLALTLALRGFLEYLGTFPSRIAAAERLCLEVEKLIPDTRMTIFSVKGGFLEMVVSPSIASNIRGALRSMPIENGWGTSATAVLRRSSVLINDANVNLHCSKFVEVDPVLSTIRASWAYPIWHGLSDIVGVINLVSSKEMLPTPLQNAMLEAVCALASLTIIEDGTVGGTTPAESRPISGSGCRFSFSTLTWRIIEVSEGACSLYGYSKSEFLSKTIFDLNPVLSERILMDLIRVMGPENSVHLSVVHRRKDGEELRVEYLTKLDHRNGEQCLSSQLIDVPDQERDKYKLQTEQLVIGSILESLDAPMVLLSPLFIVRSMNQAAGTTFGWDPSRLEGSPLPIQSRLGAEEIDELINGCSLAVSTRSTQKLELHIRRPNATTVDVEFRLDSIWDQDGSLIAISMIGQDVTETRKRAVEFGRQQSFFSEVMDSVNSIVIVMSSSGEIVQANRAFEEFTGITLSEARGRPFLTQDLLPMEFRHLGLDWFTKAIEGNLAAETAITWIDKNGSPRNIRWKSSAIYDSDRKVSFIVSVGTDVEKERIEKDLLEQARIIFENSSEMLLVADRDAVLLEANEAYLASTALSRQEVIGQRLDHRIASRHDQRWRDEVLGEAIREGFWNGTVWLRRKDESEFPTNSRIYAVKSPSGSLRKYIIVAAEISAAT